MRCLEFGEASCRHSLDGGPRERRCLRAPCSAGPCLTSQNQSPHLASERTAKDWPQWPSQFSRGLPPMPILRTTSREQPPAKSRPPCSFTALPPVTLAVCAAACCRLRLLAGSGTGGRAAGAHRTQSRQVRRARRGQQSFARGHHRGASHGLHSAGRSCPTLRPRRPLQLHDDGALGK